MGEAKRRAKIREAAFKLSTPIKRARFNIYSIGSRRSFVPYMSEELSWWSTHDEKLLGLVSRDRTDDDYFWIILARDRNGCFRCANIQTDYKSQWHAEEALRIKIAEVMNSDEVSTYGLQGDETNAPLDFFQLPTDCDPEKLHPYFRILLEDPGHAPARTVIQEIGPWLAPSDPHLVDEFQKKGFDQRLWEIYLWAVFKEFFFDIDLLEAPDFRCRGPGIDFTVEATTAAPSDRGALASHPHPKDIEQTKEFLANYMPMKFGSSLVTKLNKKNKDGLHYWQREESKNKPFLLGIADFHKPAEKDELGSMVYTQSALWHYLYGHRVYWEFEGDQLIIKPEKILEHKYGEKVIPSGFFDLPNSENISAIIFSNAGTMSKFTRMGAAAGFGADGYRYYRAGYRYNPDPNAIFGTAFSEDVADPQYQEYWTQEIQIFHNPNAKFPLPFEWFLGATHHYFEDGFPKSHTPSDAILTSYTLILKIVGTDEKILAES